MASVYAAWQKDLNWHYSSRSMKKRPWFLALLNPALAASLVFRLAASPTKIFSIPGRWLGISLFSSDISSGVRFEGAVEFPHPTGIVLGSAARLGDQVSIYQNVTLGTTPKGGYPSLGSNVTVFAGAVVVGGISVGNNSTIGANVLLYKSLPENSKFTLGGKD